MWCRLHTQNSEKGLATVLSESLLYKPTSDLTYSELPGDVPNIFAMPVVRVKMIRS